MLSVPNLPSSATTGARGCCRRARFGASERQMLKKKFGVVLKIVDEFGGIVSRGPNAQWTSIKKMVKVNARDHPVKCKTCVEATWLRGTTIKTMFIGKTSFLFAPKWPGRCQVLRKSSRCHQMLDFNQKGLLKTSELICYRNHLSLHRSSILGMRPR